MRRGRIFLLLALIILVGLGAIYAIFRFGFPGASSTDGGEPAAGEATPIPTPILTTKVVVVTQRVERGEVISVDKLSFQEYQADLVLPIMCTQLEQVAGKMARFSMDPYTVVTTALVTDVVDRAQGSDDALFIESGMVAVSIPVSRLSSISYAPMRGDRVNVIATLMFVDLDADFQTILPNWTGNVISAGGGAIVEDVGTTTPEDMYTLLAQPLSGSSVLGRIYEDPDLGQAFWVLPSEPQRPRLVSQTLIQNVMVLQLGDFPTPYERALAEMPVEPTPTPDPGAAPQAPQEEEVFVPPVPDVITLIVSPQDAVTLNYLIFSGAQLTLALRNPQDVSVVPIEPVTMTFVMDRYNIPLPDRYIFGLHPAVTELAQPVLQNDVVPTPQP